MRNTAMFAKSDRDFQKEVPISRACSDFGPAGPETLSHFPVRVMGYLPDGAVPTGGQPSAT